MVGYGDAMAGITGGTIPEGDLVRAIAAPLIARFHNWKNLILFNG
jgi:hypothetical protein